MNEKKMWCRKCEQKVSKGEANCSPGSGLRCPYCTYQLVNHDGTSLSPPVFPVMPTPHEATKVEPLSDSIYRAAPGGEARIALIDLVEFGSIISKEENSPDRFVLIAPLKEGCRVQHLVLKYFEKWPVNIEVFVWRLPVESQAQES